jgi:hypothetical protein
VLAESYFDETNTNPADGRLCVGGYIFARDAAVAHAERWRALLEKWKLPYFHMVDCAHNVGVYEHLTRPECDLAAREAIEIIKETASAGFYISVLESEYNEFVPQMKFFGSAYDSCARNIISGVASWIESNNFRGGMHYFFEAGAKTAARASQSILEMMQDEEIRRETCYAGHSFVLKESTPGVQAADLLAWHAGQQCKRALRGDPPRKDFASLIEIPHKGLDLTREMLTRMAADINDELRAAGLTTEDADALEGAMRGIRKRST